MAGTVHDAQDPTRAKLLHAAAEVFAEQGFHAATVREICTRAGANVASINYHFGDKVELYGEVLREALTRVHERPLPDLLAKLEPPEALRRAIRLILGRVCNPDRTNLTMRLMLHEMTNPTPGLARVVDEVIGPNYRMLRGIIGRLIELPPDHEKTRLCAHSVIGQILHYAQSRPVIAQLWPGLAMNQESLDMIAGHIGDFSLAYLKTYRREQGKPPARNRKSAS
jgi:TetR/AcrR family transcriptional regulator, regulator of cefoperazone and chloramphenicol sensitivity